MSAANGRAGARSHVYLPRAAAGKGHHMTLVARPSGGWCRQENERGAHWSRYRRPPHIGKFAGVRGDRRPHASPVRSRAAVRAYAPARLTTRCITGHNAHETRITVHRPDSLCDAYLRRRRSTCRGLGSRPIHIPRANQARAGFPRGIDESRRTAPAHDRSRRGSGRAAPVYPREFAPARGWGARAALFSARKAKRGAAATAS